MGAPERSLLTPEEQVHAQTHARQARCDVHGAYLSTCIFPSSRSGRGVWSTCPMCAAAEQEAERLHAQQEADRRRLQRVDAYRTAAGLTGRFSHAAFDTFAATTPAQRKALAQCRQYADEVRADSGNCLVLIGPVGTGKSHLMRAIQRHTIDARMLWGPVVTASTLIADIRDTWQKGSDETEAQVVHRYGTHGLLGLDELGLGFGTEGEQKLLFDVIDRRYREQRPTLVASNLTLPEIQAAVGERVFDRLQEGATIVVCNWPSHRKPAAKGHAA